MTTPEGTVDIDGTEIAGADPIPGYKEATAAIAKLGKHLKVHGDLWNEAWQKIVDEKFDFKTWMSFVARSANANWAYIRDYLNVGSAANAPPWLAMTLDLTKDGPVTQTSVPIAGLQIDPIPTEFAPLSSAPAIPAFVPSATRLSDGRVRISIDKPATGTPKGRYISLLFERKLQASPVLIVLLEVTS